MTSNLKTFEREREKKSFYLEIKWEEGEKKKRNNVGNLDDEKIWVKIVVGVIVWSSDDDGE